MRTLNERIESALDRIKNGNGQMRIPADPTDPDLVLVACQQRIAALESEPAQSKERIGELEAENLSWRQQLNQKHEDAIRIRDRWLHELERAESFQSELAQARQQLAGERLFPGLHGPSVPWSIIAPHEFQAKKNHDQSLQRLSERGGLGPCEMVAVLEDRRWHKMDDQEAIAAVHRIVKERSNDHLRAQLKLAINALDQISYFPDAALKIATEALAAIKERE